MTNKAVLDNIESLIYGTYPELKRKYTEQTSRIYELERTLEGLNSHIERCEEKSNNHAADVQEYKSIIRDLKSRLKLIEGAFKYGEVAYSK